MRVPGLPAMGGDRLRPRRQQRRDLPELAGQVPGATSSPSAASAETTRCTGRPSTYF